MREPRKAISQKEHERINSREYPGTRQLCEICWQPTDRCEDDAIYLDSGVGPLCEDCYHKAEASENPGSDESGGGR